MSRINVSGHYVPGSQGPIFILRRQPFVDAKGCVLVVPPFAEEMNKCRRMVTELALGLAADGIASLVPDLFGTGDSGGDFGDANWSDWQNDIARVVQWSAAQSIPVSGLLAIRLGCALAAISLSTGAVPPVRRTVLWQPVFDGSRFLAQFLRLRLVAGFAEGGEETMAGLRQRLDGDGSLEVAGYRLSKRLAGDLEMLAVPEWLPAEFGDVSWLEVVREASASLPAPSESLIERTRAHGGRIQATSFAGEPYWASTEIVINRPVISASLAHLCESVPHENS